MPATAPTVLHIALARDFHTVLATQRTYLANATRTTDAQTVALQNTALHAWTAATEQLLALFTAAPASKNALAVRVPPGPMAVYRNAYGRVLASYGRVSQASSLATINNMGTRRTHATRGTHLALSRRRRRGGTEATARPSQRRRSSVSKKQSSSEPPTSLFQRAWKGFLTALSNVKYAVALGVRTVLSLLKQAILLFFASVKLALKIAFWPVQMIGSLLQLGTRVAVRNAMYYWRISCMLIIMTMGSAMLPRGPYVLLQEATGHHPALNAILNTHKDSLRTMWDTSAKGLLTIVSVGVPQFTYDFLRIWHLLLADGTALFFGGLVHKLHSACVAMVGKKWSPFLGFDSSINPEVYYQGLCAYRKSHHDNDPLIKLYMQASETTKTKASPSVTSEWTKDTTLLTEALKKRDLEGETKAVEDIRKVTLGQVGTGMWTWFRQSPLQKTVTAVTSQSKPSSWPVLDKLQRTSASLAIQKWTQHASSRCTVHQLLCAYFVIVQGGTGSFEGVRDALAALSKAAQARNVLAAYEMMGVAAKMT